MRTFGTLAQACAAALLLSTASALGHDPGLGNHKLQDAARAAAGPQAAELNGTQPGATDDRSLVKGFICLGLCVIGYGSSLTPIKNTDTGDGLFFQWVFCTSLWLVSFLVHAALDGPRVWLLSMLGGFLWSIGNLATIPILKTVGLGVGYLIWSMTTLLIGWATARFGWFGLDRQGVRSPTLNYVGTALATISCLILFLVKTEIEQGESEERQMLLKVDIMVLDGHILGGSSKRSWVDRLCSKQKKALGCLLAIFAGLLYGCAYTPIIYIKNQALKNNTGFSGASQYDLDYIFSFSTGVYAMSTIIFFGYCMAMKNKPNLPSQCVLPAFFAGSMLAASNCFWLVACSHLETITTYPIGTAGPALVSLAWSVFYFKEIKGTKNLLILTAVLATVLTGVALIILSKIA